jgi:hypothetical protein
MIRDKAFPGENVKPSKEWFRLHILLVKLYSVAGFRGSTELLPAKIQFQRAVWMRSAQTGASFRFPANGQRKGAAE